MKTTMKQIKHFILPIFALICIIGYTGCKSNSVTGPVNPTNLSFTMQTQTGPTGGIQFGWKPSVGVKNTKLIVIGPGTSGSDTITDNSGGTYTNDQFWTYPNEYTTVSGTWNFKFTGTVAADNTPYTGVAATVNVP